MSSSIGFVGSKILNGGINLAKTVKPQELYYVSRTKSNNLPVYKQAKRGGNKLETKVQKVEGDAQQLKRQLIDALGVDAADVQVNGLTKHVIIKGWKMDEVKQFLEKKHF